MEKLKLFAFALLTIIGVTVGIFFVGNLLINLFGLLLVFTIFHSIGVMVILLCTKYLVHFLFPPQPVSNPLLENENNYLRDMNSGLTIIIASIVKYKGGELRFPSYFMNLVNENTLVNHITDYETKEEVFKIVEEEKPVGDSKLN